MRKVLVVEDNQDISAILRKRLEDNLFEVDIVESGYDLLIYLNASSEPDAVILDLMLPGKSGIELLYGLKCKWSSSKVFIFTAYSRYEHEDSFKGYISGFFCKSDGMDKLIEAIKSSF